MRAKIPKAYKISEVLRHFDPTWGAWEGLYSIRTTVPLHLQVSSNTSSCKKKKTKFEIKNFFLPSLMYQKIIFFFENFIRSKSLTLIFSETERQDACNTTGDFSVGPIRCRCKSLFNFMQAITLIFRRNFLKRKNLISVARALTFCFRKYKRSRKIIQKK